MTDDEIERIFYPTGTATPNQLQIARAVGRAIEGKVRATPIDMVLHCPACGLQHIDAPELDLTENRKWFAPLVWAWENPPHRSHLCHGCGHIWRPADVPTNGVAAVQTHGQHDSPIVEPPRRLNNKP